MMLRVCGVALLTAFTAFLLRESGFRGASIVAAVGSVALLSLCGDSLGELIPPLAAFAQSSTLSDHATAVMKVVGIGWLSGACADLCRELDAAGVAGVVSTVGRVAMLTVALPFVTELIELALSVIG